MVTTYCENRLKRLSEDVSGGKSLVFRVMIGAGAGVYMDTWLLLLWMCRAV